MQSKYCAQCGSNLILDSRFCNQCGAAVNSQTHKPLSDDSNQPTFVYPKEERHSEIITTDDRNGQPVVKFRNLHPNAVWLFFMQYLGKTSIILLLLIVTSIFEPYISIGTVSGYLLILYLIALVNYKSYEFEVSTVAFQKKHGVFHKYTVNIAFDQIQNINKRRSIIDQFLGLAHLEIETAGTGGMVKRSVSGLLSGSEGYIPGITPQEAEDVMRLMLARIQKN